MKRMLKVAAILIVGSVCFMQSLQAAKAKENQCFFPAYDKAARFCDIAEVDEKKCEEAKLESGYEDFENNVISLLDDIKYEDFGREPCDTSKQACDMENEKIIIESFDISKILIDAIGFAYLNPEYEDYEAFFNHDDYNVPQYNTIREATNCNGKNCTTQGYNDNGKLIFEANCVNGINHGKQTIYTESGELLMELNYNNGKLDGIQKLPNHDVERYININDIEYDRDGFVLNEVEIKNGKLNGKLDINYNYNVSFAPYGEGESLMGEFKNGKPISTIKYKRYAGQGVNWVYETFIFPFDKNSNLNGVKILLGESRGGWIVFDTYKNNKLISSEYYGYTDDVHNIECYIPDNILDAKYDDMIESKIKYSNCVQSYFSQFERFYDIDSKSLEAYKDGSLIVSYAQKHFNDSKQKSGKWVSKQVYGGRYGDIEKYLLETTETNYKNDKLNGAQKTWLNGKLIKEVNYTNDVIDGTLKEWDINGNLIKAEIYKNGNRVQIIR